MSNLIRPLSNSKWQEKHSFPSQQILLLPCPASLKDCLSGQSLGSLILYTDILPSGEPAELHNVLGFVSLILSLITPNFSWQGSCQAISGNKNSLHTSLLIFPLLCLLLKCFSLHLLKKQHCNYWKLALPAAYLRDQRVLLMFLGGVAGGARATHPYSAVLQE